MGAHKNRLAEAILTSTHNIGFYEDLTKIIFELSSNIIKYAPYFFCCFFSHPFLTKYVVYFQAGLMDQDLSLMKQLLTLNEAIEDIKWQRNYYSSQSSMAASSCDLNESDWSVSETDMFGSESDDLDKQTTVASPVTAQRDAIKRQESRTADDKERINGNSKDSQTVKILPTKNQTFVVSNETRNYLGLPVELDFFLNGKPNYCHVEKLNSFDFRANEHVLRKQITV